jgi:FAD:protein FMN transferase
VVGTGVAAMMAPASLGVTPRVGYRRAGPAYRHFVERWSWAMGQPVHLQLFAGSEAQGYDAAAAALAELRRVEARLTLFEDASDLSELNRRAGRGVFRGDRDLVRILAAGLAIEHATGGAFNPAIEPLMRAWGFRVPRASPPSEQEISEARAAVKAARVVLEGDRISIPTSDTRLDLGGIGVGYGLDRAGSILRRMEIRSAFLDLSGDCIAIGAPAGEEEGWLVEIAGLRPDTPPIASTRLRDTALATSSNTMSVVRYGRAVRGHVMDPDTGWPADHVAQVSVVARTGTEADALSTGMLVSAKPTRGVLRYYRA